MIKTEIYIENKRLDIVQDLPSLLSFAIDDIKDIGSRNTSFSKTIILPGTANNNFLFGHIFDIRSSNPYNEAQDNVGLNFNAAKQAECKIFQDHLQIFKGVIRVLKVVILNGVCEYECAVFGELGGLVNSMGSGKLQDLDFSAYDHVLNTGNVSGSWDNINGSGYFYPLIDIGEVSVNKQDYEYKAFRPALYVKEYIDKIFTEAGYDYECDLFNTARFKSLIIPCNQKILQSAQTVLIDAERDAVAAMYNDEIISSGSGDTSRLYWDAVDVLNFTANPIGGQFDYFTYNVAQQRTGTIRLVAHGYATNGSGASLQIRIRKNGAQLGQLITIDVGSVEEEWSVDELRIVDNLSNLDEIDVEFSATGDTSSYEVRCDIATLLLESDLPQYVEVNYGNDVTLNDTIPKNILQKDFFSSILRLFNLYVYEDKLKPRFVYIKPQIDFYSENVSGVIDWTYKVDRSRPIDITPMSELNSRFYDFKFKSDSDYYNELYRNRYGEGYGDYLFDSQFDFANERTDIQLIFSASPLVGYTGVDKIVTATYKLNNTSEEKMDHNIRILQAKKITAVNNWHIELNGVDIGGAINSYGYAGHYDDPDVPSNDIQFGVPAELFFTVLAGAINVTQFNVYWSAYMAEITDKDSKLLRAYFKLNNKDIYDLDFSKLIYVDGAYLRLNRITDWNANEPDVCQVELLKVIYRTY